MWEPGLVSAQFSQVIPVLVILREGNQKVF